jgi:uncharacterized protein (DUF2267 family)
MKNTLHLIPELHVSPEKDFVSLVANDLHFSREKATRIINAVFHALRSRLDQDEFSKLLALLPAGFGLLCVDDQHEEADKPTRNMGNDDFVEEVQKQYVRMTGFYLGYHSRVSMMVKSVFRAINALLVKSCREAVRPTG